MSERDSVVIRTDATKRGEFVDLVLMVDLPRGVHIEPSQPTEPNLIPTVLTVGGIDDAIVEYPQPVVKDLGWKDAKLTILEGSVRFTISGKLAALAAEADRISGALTFQPCIGGACLPPRTVRWSAPLPGTTAYSVLSALAA